MYIGTYSAAISRGMTQNRRTCWYRIAFARREEVGLFQGFRRQYIRSRQLRPPTKHLSARISVNCSHSFDGGGGGAWCGWQVPSSLRAALGRAEISRELALAARATRGGRRQTPPRAGRDARAVGGNSIIVMLVAEQQPLQPAAVILSSSTIDLYSRRSTTNA